MSQFLLVLYAYVCVQAPLNILSSWIWVKCAVCEHYFFLMYKMVCIFFYVYEPRHIAADWQTAGNLNSISRANNNKKKLKKHKKTALFYSMEWKCIQRTYKKLVDLNVCSDVISITKPLTDLNGKRLLTMSLQIQNSYAMWHLVIYTDWQHQRKWMWEWVQAVYHRHNQHLCCCLSFLLLVHLRAAVSLQPLAEHVSGCFMSLVFWSRCINYIRTGNCARSLKIWQ